MISKLEKSKTGNTKNKKTKNDNLIDVSSQNISVDYTTDNLKQSLIKEVEINNEIEPNSNYEDQDLQDDNDETNDDSNKKKKKSEYNCENIDQALEELNKIDLLLEQHIKTRKMIFKSIQKIIQKRMKGGKKKINNSNINKENTGFTKLKIVPPKFKDFYEKNLRNNSQFNLKFPSFDINNDLSRPQITKIIYFYIKQNNLYYKDESGEAFNKRHIKPDDTIKTLLMIEDTEDIKFTNFQTYLRRLYNSINSEE